MSTIAYPSDPTVKGATEIQATTFALVPADYDSAEWSAVRRLVFAHGIKNFRGFPRGDTDGSNWRFFVRVDQTGDTADLRNIVGIKETRENAEVLVYSAQAGRDVVRKTTIIHQEVHNWYPVQITLADTVTVLTYWVDAGVTYSFALDPETRLVLAGDGAHRAITEAQGFVNTQVAANKPTNAPAMKLLAGARMPI